MRLVGLSLFAAATLSLLATTSTASAQGLGTDASTPTASATLAIQFDQAPSASSTRVLELMASGAPPSGAIEFVDSSGAHVAAGYVTVVAPGASCQHAQVLHTGLGDTPWCLKVRELTTGVALTGTLVGPSSTVTLTLNSRDSLLWPVLATVFSLVLALALLYVVSYGLPSWIPKIQLGIRVSRDADKISGLDDWVAKAQAHSSLAAVAAQERWMRRTGVAEVRDARRRLKSALEASQAIPVNAPLRTTAKEEADIPSSAPVAASDMLDVDGKHAVSHAATLLGLVERAQKFIVEWQQQVGALKARPGADGEQSMRLLDEGQRTLEGLSAWTIDDVESSLRGQLVTAFGTAPRATRHVAGIAYEMETLTGESGRLFALNELRLPTQLAPVAAQVARSAQKLVSIADLAAAGVVTVGAVLALVLVAAATALAANYASNHTFGSFADYATLTTSAFGSASVATVLGVGLLWTKIRDSKA